MPDPTQQEVSTYRLSLSAPFDLTSQLAELISQVNADDPPAVSTHETKDPAIWGLDAYFEIKPDLDEIRDTLETAFTALALPLPLPPMELVPMEDMDWVSLVQKELSPIRAGRYFIYGSHDRARAGQRAGDIEIDAGQAFGTAHHGTTKGCLLALDDLFKAHQFDNILDLGTGTGLLAIAAAKVLKQTVMASDIDPISVKIANENAALNQVGTLLYVVEADGLAHPELQNAAPYDLMIANILAAPLRSMAPSIQECMQPGGYLVLSGLLRTQSRSIEACYRARGFTLKKRIPLDEWMTLILYYG